MEKKNDIGLAIRKLSNLIKRDIEKSKCRIGIDPLSGVNGWAIGYFYENRTKDVFQKDFEEAFSIRRSTASKILKTMEQKNLIERISVDFDARLKKIVLTHKAVEIHEKIMTDIANRELRLRRGISEEELQIFFNVIKKLSENMETDL